MMYISSEGNWRWISQTEVEERVMGGVIVDRGGNTCYGVVIAHVERFILVPVRQIM
jgi:hypothetical protein